MNKQTDGFFVWGRTHCHLLLPSHDDPTPQPPGAYGGKAIAVGRGGTLDIHGRKGVPKFAPGLRALNITGVCALCACVSV